MTRYISILRGINVSGQKKIRMADLKLLYENAGFTNVVTYIQSGNVVFDTGRNESDRAIEQQIKQAILAQYGFDVPVLVRTVDEVRHTLAVNPFLEENDIDTEKLHVTFLADLPDPSNVDELGDVDYPPDRFRIIGKDVFIHCPDRYGETKLSNAFFERKLKVQATTRNWKTVNKLFELAVGTIDP